MLDFPCFVSSRQSIDEIKKGQTVGGTVQMPLLEAEMGISPCGPLRMLHFLPLYVSQCAHQGSVLERVLFP